MMHRFILSSLAALSVIFLASSLGAATIRIDLGRSDQETSLTSWNDYSGLVNPGTLPSGPFSLTYTTGADSGIDLSISQTGTAGFNGLAANYAGPYPAAIASFPTSVNRDGVYLTSGTITATLSNLNPLATYGFLFYGADGNAGAPGVATTWTVTGLNVGADTITVTHDNLTEVALVSNIIPDGSNEISILMTSPGIGRWNVLQISEATIPEPSTFLLVGLAACGLMRHTRRQRRVGWNKRSAVPAVASRRQLFH